MAAESNVSIHEYLSRVQRRTVTAAFLIWLAMFLAGFSGRPRLALGVSIAAFALLVGLAIYLYRGSRCPRCGTALLFNLHKLVPLGPFKPRLHHCPSCGVSMQEPAA